jgi:hypothetical protein
VISACPLLPALVGSVSVHVPAAAATVTVTVPEEEPLMAEFPLAAPPVLIPAGRMRLFDPSKWAPVWIQMSPLALPTIT